MPNLRTGRNRTANLPGFFEQPSAQRWVVGLLLGLFFLLMLSSARHLSLTYDEGMHLKYGKQILRLNSDRIDDSKMPFTVLNALPETLAERLPEGWLRAALGSLLAARSMTMLFSVLVAFFVFRWGRELYGFIPAVFALLLYIFEPNIIAHSQLATTDLYATGTIFLSIYALWRFSQERDVRRAGLFGLALGLAQVAKYTAVFLYPLALILLLVRDYPNLRAWIAARERRLLWGYLRQMALFGLLIILLSLLVVNAGFLFNRSFLPFGEYSFQSDLLQAAQARFPILNRLPVPVPFPYLQGLDLVRFYERTGENFSRIYLLGQLNESGFPGYYLAASLFKVPIAIQAAFLLSFIACSRRKDRRFIENELFLLGPIIFFTLYFNFFYRAQIGIRYFLVVFPFIHMFSASLLAGWKSFRARTWAAVGTLSVYLIVSVLSYYPHYIPYFNELVPDRRMAYKILADSNLDWGQAGWYVAQYKATHPEAVLDPPEPTAGLVAVSANNVVGITAKPKTFQWLRENFTPIDTVAYAYLVYDISPEELNSVLSNRHR
jgi:4-amino-4-deoxy-L-arabinose transferase-like glycosyltransferase